MCTFSLLFAGYVQTWCARPRVQCFFLFLKILFPQPQHCVVCPQYVPTGYVHSETDGLMLLEMILKVSAALPVHCGQP